VKYRGSAHGTNEYPFMIDQDGISVLPVTSLTLGYQAFDERVSSGIPGLDEMFGGGGFYRGSSILVSGTAGTGKSSIGAGFVSAACRRGERALYVSFEEAQDQLIRNMRSIGLDLRQWVDADLLHYHATRATVFGLEMHLVSLYKLVNDFSPSVVVIDPMTSLMGIGTSGEVQSTLTRLIDFLKSRGITTIFTSLVEGGVAMDRTEESVSSLMDTWLLLRNVEFNGERNRTLYVLKSRGMEHSNQVREFLLTNDGVQLIDAYIGPAGVLTGTARLQQEARERAEAEALREEIGARRVQLERKRLAVDARVEELRAEFAAEEQETKRHIHEAEVRMAAAAETSEEIRRRRTGTGRGEHAEGRVD
jgi:circadian clock protein KaiC